MKTDLVVLYLVLASVAAGSGLFYVVRKLLEHIRECRKPEEAKEPPSVWADPDNEVITAAPIGIAANLSETEQDAYLQEFREAMVRTRTTGSRRRLNFDPLSRDYFTDVRFPPRTPEDEALTAELMRDLRAGWDTATDRVLRIAGAPTPQQRYDTAREALRSGTIPGSLASQTSGRMIRRAAGEMRAARNADASADLTELTAMNFDLAQGKDSTVLTVMKVMKDRESKKPESPPEPAWKSRKIRRFGPGEKE